MKGTGIMDCAPKALLARALYDNCPDCSDELAFSRGDILTILEQHVPESEGWWKCLLHGRQGLAPANRLQILTEVAADRPCPPFLRGLEEAPASSEETYQAILTLPRPVRASLPTLPSQVYDVPTQHRGPVVLKEPEKQQLYDIPASPKKAGLHPPASQASGQGVPLVSVTTLRRGGYSTLPNPQKSEWIYDTPVSPGKASVRNTPLTSFAEESRPHALPSSSSTFHSPPSGRSRSLTPQLNNNVPMQKKLSLPEIPSYGFLVPRGTFPLDEDVSYKVPSSFLIPRVERQNTKPNIYDIPKAMSSVSQAGKELEKAKEVSENSAGHNSSWFSRRTTSPSPEPDRLSGSSSDSRASVVSSCSTTSTDDSSSSSSEESAKELSLDLDVAKETVMALQHKVVSSVAGLMLFVSRKWRFRDYLEANIDAIHRSTDHIEESVREFLDFARGVHGTACNLTDSNLQNRIRDQMQTISNSYRILLETKESLDNRNWPLEVLVTDSVQNSPDDLERFVMVARMLPEDIKRFASIVIANGRLLFKRNCEKEETVQLTPNAEFKCEKYIQPPQRETESHQKSTPSTKQREDEHSSELLKKNRANICGQNPGPLIPQPSSQQTPERKPRLSEHCRLYFGALFKAISAFHGSLSSSQPAEIITQSKLVIMVGQKLVDTLCMETQERDVRNEILRGSSHLCSLLKDVALATKNAVLTYPSPAALGHLQAEAEKLEQHTRQFRGTLG
ncbi:cas scaffolding protein family member 4 isoform X3 [Gorilla gorilla gorilla]|uniref:cas scaffolding protein family member 4 isoform X3 n=1 Tax=Gorilla gorilla gorilla TaxID=9595 RepID=UPI00029DCE6A|nr:cas scaffolding protein family member 4 isoform X2 [Gorilla gorilla gorilla]XP_055228864.1 cas scaffolding protein family member 4 isoform X2 [Gorilla gorilla gorilla]